MPRRVLIVGAGLAGSRCAESLRAEGFDGGIVLIGDESRPPYERPALSKQFLAGESDGLELRTARYWSERGIELALGRRVESIDLLDRTAGGFAWDALVIATGARPRRLPLAMPLGAHLLRSAEDAAGLRAELVPGCRLVIVGAGFIGAEVASTARARGVHVTLIDTAGSPLERVLGPEVGDLLAERYRGAGIDLRLRTGIRRFAAREGRIEGVELTDGTVVPCDAALVAVGVEAAAELVGEGPAGIPTDACGRTEIPGVYACGDVARWWRPSLGRHVRVEHWTSAAGQGVAVARAILGQARPYDDTPYFWSDQFGLRLQHVGHAEEWAEVEIACEGETLCARYLDGSGRLLAALLGNRPRDVAALRRELAPPLRPVPV